MIVAMIMIAASFSESNAQQQYKLRQATGFSGMNSETTIYVKKMRKRTEMSPMMGMSQPTTIEQCDLKRTIKINDKKKIYFIEPFGSEEVIDEDVKPAVVKTKPAVTPVEKGGVIHMYYNIRDTGERKKMHGFTARHIWTTQKMKPSPEACSMKDSMIIKTDGWYVDLPEFNCPIRYNNGGSNPQNPQQPACKDKFVSHRSGNGKLGFALMETRTIIMNGQSQTFSMSMETLELSTAKLDSMLFEIPPGYRQVMDESELADKFDASEYMKSVKENNNNPNKNNNANVGGNTDATNVKSAGAIRIGVYEPTGEGDFPRSSLQQHLANDLNVGNIEAISVANEEEAKQKNCDYSLATDFSRFKAASKVGGLIKAIKNTDPNAASSFNIDAGLVLTKLGDGSVKLNDKVSGKYEGKPEDAAKKALDVGANKVLKALN